MKKLKINVLLLITLIATIIFLTNIIASITSITLISPSNNAWTNDNTPSFSFRAISNSDSTFSCHLTVDGSNVVSNDSVVNNTNTVFTSDILNDGSHRWNITCADSIGVSTSETRTINIDSQEPQINLISPSDGSSLSSKEVSFKFKVTDNLDTSLSCELYVDGDKEKTGNVNNNSQVTWTLTLTRGSHDWQVKCKDNANNEKTSSEWDFEITSGAGAYCSDGEQGNYLTISIENPEEDETIIAGENVSIKVKVTNEHSDDLNIIVKAQLYDLDKDDDIVTVTKETTISEDSTKTLTLYLEVPSTVNPDHDFIIRAKVYEKNNEEEQCKEDYINVNVNKKEHLIVINDLKVIPTIVNCGSNFSVYVDISNKGLNEENVKIIIKNSELNIDFSKTLLIDESKNYYNSFIFSVPKDASEKNYNIEMKVYYGEDYELYISRIVNLEVKGDCFVEQRDASLSLQQVSDAFVGKEFTIKLTITNTGNVPTDYFVSVSDYESWATLSRIEPENLTIESGNNGYVYIVLTPLENASGSQSFKVIVNFGSVSKEQTISIDVRKESKAASWLEQLSFEFRRSWQWFIVDALLVAAIIVLSIFLIKARRENKRLSGEYPKVKIRTIKESDFKIKK
ncbi:MAG: putative S-layer protein [Candidatus Pacearchaeota archaeon]